MFSYLEKTIILDIEEKKIRRRTEKKNGTIIILIHKREKQIRYYLLSYIYIYLLYPVLLNNDLILFTIVKVIWIIDDGRLFFVRLL